MKSSDTFMRWNQKETSELLNDKETVRAKWPVGKYKNITN